MTEACSDSDIHALLSTYLFGGINQNSTEELKKIVKVRNVRKKEHIFRQGDRADFFYWVSEGRVKLFRSSDDGGEKVIDLVREGRFFAEAVIFMEGCYPVSAVAEAQGRLLALDGVLFKNWLRQDVDRCFRMLATVSMRIHKLLSEIEKLTLMKGEDRLYMYFTNHAIQDRHGHWFVDVNIPKQLIASQISVKPETFSRLLNRLVEMEKIRIDGRFIYLIDIEK